MTTKDLQAAVSKARSTISGVRAIKAITARDVRNIEQDQDLKPEVISRKVAERLAKEREATQIELEALQDSLQGWAPDHRMSTRSDALRTSRMTVKPPPDTTVKDPLMVALNTQSQLLADISEQMLRTGYRSDLRELPNEQLMAEWAEIIAEGSREALQDVDLDDLKDAMGPIRTRASMVLREMERRRAAGVPKEMDARFAVAGNRMDEMCWRDVDGPAALHEALAAQLTLAERLVKGPEASVDEAATAADRAMYASQAALFGDTEASEALSRTFDSITHREELESPYLRARYISERGKDAYLSLAN